MSPFPAMREFKSNEKTTYEGVELARKFGTNADDRFTTQGQQNSMTNKHVEKEVKEMTAQEKKEDFAFAITEYDRLNKEAALAASSGDKDKYSQLTIEMEKLSLKRKKAVAFAVTEYERLGTEAALAACKGDTEKYSQLTLEMEKLAPAFADDGERLPHVAYAGDDYENPEEAFSDEDATREAEKIWRTHCGYGG